MNDKIMVNRDIVIIGGGPAGLAAALAAKKEGAESILILERDKELGGILNQCIHCEYTDSEFLRVPCLFQESKYFLFHSFVLQQLPTILPGHHQ